jgi:pyrroloquinoline quinone biosynthesis protein B
VSADGERWLLVNASPDVRHQVQWLAPKAGRGSGIAAVAVTSADVDHVAGLLVLREGGAPPLYMSREVEDALTGGLSILPALGAYGHVDVRHMAPGSAVSFADKAGRPLGIEADVIDVHGKPPLYVRARTGATGAAPGHCVALALRASSSASVVYAPGLSGIDAALEKHLRPASVILVDGTCFRDDELAPLGGRTSREMGHLPLAGEDGILARLSGYANARRILVHINNTNPVYRPGTKERELVLAQGVEVGEDGMEVVV